MLLRVRIKSRRDIEPHILPELFVVFPATTLKYICEHACMSILFREVDISQVSCLPRQILTPKCRHVYIYRVVGSRVIQRHIPYCAVWLQISDKRAAALQSYKGMDGCLSLLLRRGSLLGEFGWNHIPKRRVHTSSFGQIFFWQINEYSRGAGRRKTPISNTRIKKNDSAEPSDQIQLNLGRPLVL